MEATITPHFITICTEEGSANERAIARRVQTAVENNGQCIYNVNDGSKYDLPRILPLKECINEIPEGEHFTGWVGFEKIQMIDLAAADKANGTSFALLLDSYAKTFSQETRDMLDDQSEDFWPDEGCTSVAIRVDNPDGTWFEYIVSDTVANS